MSACARRKEPGVDVVPRLAFLVHREHALDVRSHTGSSGMRARFEHRQRVRVPPYAWSVAAVSAPASNSRTVISAALAGTTWRRISTPLAAV